MNDALPYSSAADVLADRVRWSMALLARGIEIGRREGWLDGEPTESPDPSAIEQAITARVMATGAELAVLPMEWLAVRLRLSSDQLALLWLLACVELRPACARLATAFGAELTVQTLGHLLPISNADLDALMERGLIEMATDAQLPLHRRSMRASDRVIDLARGEIGIDRALRTACELVVDELSGETELPDPLVRAFEAGAVIVVQGATGSGRSTLLLRLAARTGNACMRVRVSELARDGRSLERRMRAVARECELFGAVPLLVDIESADELASMIERELRSTRGPLLIASHIDQRWRFARATVVHRVDPPRAEVREQIWRQALTSAGAAVIVEAAARYPATPGTIIAAAEAATVRRGQAAAVGIEDVHEGLRAHLDQRLADLGTRVRCTQTWDDLVLPSDQLEQIVELIARVRHRRHVLDDWGFAEKVGRGVGLAALLSGPPGTGKTMIAGLIANELGLDLYQVDLSRIVSKYIGETEKHLARVFDAAESGHAILLFDEADALFAKRSEVKSSNDRYANLEVNFLLQRIEQFTGIALLTTNHERNIDEAFRRRLAVHVRFAMPDTEQRAQLWRAMLPDRAPVAPDIDFARLANDLVMTGGYIKNAVLRAAYSAADEGSSIGMHHLWRAARAEYEAMGKLALRDVA
jgi:ATP-dependent 26S proteasome regulatory subunit